MGEKLKIINFRSFLIIAISIALSIFFAYITFIITWLGWLLIAIQSLILIFIYVRQVNSDNKLFKRITFLIACIVGFAVFLNFLITTSVWSKNITNGSTYQISGSIDDIYTIDSSLVIILRDTKVDGDDTSGKIKCYIDNYQYTLLNIAKVGDEITLDSVLYRVDIVNDEMSINSSNFRYNIRYTAYVDALQSTRVIPDNPTLLDKIKQKIQDICIDNMGQEYGNLAYGMLVGDTRDMYSSQVRNFSISGLAHVLSVSGLHIGFFTLILLFVLKKLKLNKYAQLGIIVFTLSFYSIIAGFSPSVIRAVVMCIVGVVASLLFREKDMLSTLLFSFCLILLVKPIYFFEVGFILSFSAVLSLILFSKQINKVLLKIKIPKKIASYLSASISAQIGITPAIIYFFNTLQIYSILVNTITVPLLMIVFIFLIVALFVTLIIPPLSIFLKISGIGVAIVDEIARFFAMLPYASITIFASGIVFLSYIPMFLASRFINFPPNSTARKKYCFNIINVVIILVLSFYNVVFYFDYNDKSYLIPIHEYNGVTTLVTYKNKIFLVGDVYDYNSIQFIVKKYKIKKIESVLLFNLTENVAKNVVSLSSLCYLNSVVLYSQSEISGLNILIENDIKNFYLFDKNDLIYDVFDIITYDNALICYRFNSEKTEILFFSNNKSYNNLYENELNKTSIIRCKYYLNEYSDRIYITNYEPFFEVEDNSEKLYNFIVSKTESFVFDYNNGQVYKT